MHEIIITWQVLLELLGAIIVIGGAGVVIKRWIKPFHDTKEKVGKHSEAIESLEKANKMQCKCMVALLDHEITGNSVNKLKEAKKDLQNYLIEK